MSARACRGCGRVHDESMLDHDFCPRCVRKITKRMRKRHEVVLKRRGKKTGKPKHLRERGDDKAD